MRVCPTRPPVEDEGSLLLLHLFKSQYPSDFVRRCFKTPHQFSLDVLLEGSGKRPADVFHNKSPMAAVWAQLRLCGVRRRSEGALSPDICQVVAAPGWDGSSALSGLQTRSGLPVMEVTGDGEVLLFAPLAYTIATSLGLPEGVEACAHIVSSVFELFCRRLLLSDCPAPDGVRQSALNALEDLSIVPPSREAGLLQLHRPDPADLGDAAACFPPEDGHQVVRGRDLLFTSGLAQPCPRALTVSTASLLLPLAEHSPFPGYERQ